MFLIIRGNASEMLHRQYKKLTQKKQNMKADLKAM